MIGLMSIRSKTFISFVVILTIIILDQVSKVFVLNSEVSSVCNTGVAFGILPGFPHVLISTGVVFVMSYFFVREERKTKHAALLLIIGGSLSNILDRLTRGCVVDFIKVSDFFPAFNLADAVITCGIILLLVSTLFKSEAKNPDILDH